MGTIATKSLGDTILDDYHLTNFICLSDITLFSIMEFQEIIELLACVKIVWA